MTARVDARSVAVFAVVAFGGAWLVCLPMLLDPRGLAAPGGGDLRIAMMLMPTVAVLAVVALRREWSGLAHRTGLRGSGLRRSGLGRWWPWALLAWLGPLVLTAASIALAAAVGVFRPDLVTFSGFAEVLHSRGVGALPVPVAVLAWLQLVQVVVVGWLNVIPALAEEWGWRGWLLPALLPFGRWPAVLATGVVWGLWHAPLLVLGYNYPRFAPVGSILLMVGFCVVVGSLLGWLRLRSDSVWPCAIGHGFVNAAAGLPLVVATAGQPVENATTGLLGWTGWLVCAAAFGLVAAVVRRRDPAPVGAAT